MTVGAARLSALLVLAGVVMLVWLRGGTAPDPAAPVARVADTAVNAAPVVTVPAPPAAPEVAWTTAPRVIPPEEKREPNLPPRHGSVAPVPENVLDFPNLVRGDGPLIIKSGATRVRLADIETVADNELCEGITGGRWRCGRQALIFLHRLVSNQFVSCTPTARLGPDLIEGRCWIEAGTTLNERLVIEGWAIPKPEARERYADAIAERCRRGTERIPQHRLCPATPAR
jgi:endonuclease YncB( thermonuclease family)